MTQISQTVKNLCHLWKSYPGRKRKMTNRDPQTYAIIGAGMEVHKHLGAGFLEAVYHKALAIELTARGIPFQHEVDLIIRYKDHQKRSAS